MDRGALLVRPDETDGERALLHGVLLCEHCRRLMLPMIDDDGRRAYWCGPRCRLELVAAGPVESSVLLAVLVRAVTQLESLPRKPVVLDARTGRWTPPTAAERRARIAGALAEVVAGTNGRLRYRWKR